MKQTKQERVAIVNQIIKEISERGRKFFYGRNGLAEIIVKNGKVYYKSEYNGQDICLSIPDSSKPQGWHHGGTLLALCRDFRDYIKTGGKENHGHGYGGLYCSNWGYPPEDMKEIQDKAKELGYL